VKTCKTRDNLNDIGKEKTEASNLKRIHLLGRLLQTKTPQAELKVLAKAWWQKRYHHHPTSGMA
jgi:hypothetical protein